MEQTLDIEVKSRMDLTVTVVTSIPIPKYSDIVKRPIIFNNCTKDLWRQGARTKGQPQYETIQNVIEF